jgi:YHS domain-containing protein
MKLQLLLSGLIFSIFISLCGFAQQDQMMKKDHMKKNMEMKSDSMMMKDNMHKDMKMKKDDMKKEIMMKNDTKTESKSMMKKDMMMDHKMMKVNKDENGAAINGYDPVAYFTDNKSEMGKKEFSYKWMDADWYFANKNHKEMFEKNPDKYAPQYGGYCAYAVTEDVLSKTDPNVWHITDGKLYLCTNGNAGEKWKKDIKGNIKKADEMWPKLNSQK